MTTEDLEKTVSFSPSEVIQKLHMKIDRLESAAIQDKENFENVLKKKEEDHYSQVHRLTNQLRDEIDLSEEREHALKILTKDFMTLEQKQESEEQLTFVAASILQGIYAGRQNAYESLKPAMAIETSVLVARDLIERCRQDLIKKKDSTESENSTYN